MRHPPLEQLARHLHAVAKLVDTHADHDRVLASVGKDRCLLCRAATLGSLSVGFPSSTLGDGTGSRGSDSTSSTERAAGVNTTSKIPHPPDPWATIDHELATHLRAAWHHTARLAITIDRILAHAPDDDPLPAGHGPCTIKTCDHTCRPRRDPDDRLRRGLCPACWTSWQKHRTRYPGTPDMVWLAKRTAALRPRPTQT